MMASSFGLPKSPVPSFRDTAAAWVGCADLVTGSFQFDSADGPAVVAEGDAVRVVASGVGVSWTAGTVASAVTAGTGAGAGATGTAEMVGTGTCTVGVGRGVSEGAPVDFPVTGVSGGVFCSSGKSSQRVPQGASVSPSSAWAGAAANRQTVSASTAAAAASGSTEEDRIVVTFGEGARHPSAASEWFP
jgi:hypothetical protein